MFLWGVWSQRLGIWSWGYNSRWCVWSNEGMGGVWSQKGYGPRRVWYHGRVQYTTVLTSSGSHQSGQYTSYWNTFLLQYRFSFCQVLKTEHILRVQVCKETCYIHSIPLIFNFNTLWIGFLHLKSESSTISSLFQLLILRGGWGHHSRFRVHDSPPWEVLTVARSVLLKCRSRSLFGLSSFSKRNEHCTASN